MTDVAALEPLGEGRWTLTYERHYAHAPEKVWRAITDPDLRTTWFPDTVDGDFTTVGAKLTFSTDGDWMEPFFGEVLASEAPRLLEITWGGDVLRMELTATGEGTTLRFTDTITEQGKAARDGAGWHACLDNLVHAIEGTDPPSNPGKLWAALFADYQSALGPEASTQGPPEGWTPPD